VTEAEYVKKNAPLWKELESETAFFKKRSGFFGSLSTKEPITRNRIDRYTVMYNQAANHLAYVRTFFGETETAKYLNRLVGNAHGIVYARKTYKIRDGLRFLWSGFPKLFRRELLMFAISFLLMFGGFLTAYLYTVADVRNVSLFYDESSLQNLRAEGQYEDYSVVTNTLLGTYIGENNIIVCLEALAGGFTLGIFTSYVLIYNGIIIGALAGYCHVKGTALFFWSLILPHGITELFAIMLSGMAGLMIAYSFINPGRVSRKTSMIIAGKKACGIAVVCVLLLIISAVIEGNFTPLDLPYWEKYAFSAIMFCLLVSYLSFPGREKSLLQS